MKNITFSADEEIIEAARKRAQDEHTTLNNAFRRWLTSYAGKEKQVSEAKTVMRELRGKVRVGCKLSREEMNER